MKTIEIFILSIISIFSIQISNAQCNGTVTFTGTDPTFTFTNTNTNLASGQYYWNFGDGNTSFSGATVSHTYSNNGTYWVIGYYSDSANMCSDVDSVLVQVGNASGGNPMGCSAVFSYTDSAGFYTFTGIFPLPGGTFNWTTSTGLSSTSATPTFPLSANDTVCLTVTDSSGNCTDSYCTTISSGSSQSSFVYGTVMLGTIPADNGVVFLVEYDSAGGTLSAVDTTSIDSFGSFVFTQVQSGTYYVKAALSPASAYYSSYLPTYYAAGGGPSGGLASGVLLWNNASLAVVSPMSSVLCSIDMIAGNNPGGSGFVGGLVSQGANKVGDPISDIQIMVLDTDGEPVAYAYSDINGSFSIDNLPYGDYVLYPEVMGKITNSKNFTIANGNSAINNFRVEVNSTDVTVSIATGIEEASELLGVHLYPNPVSDVLNIDMDMSTQNEATIEMLDITGRRLMIRHLSGVSAIQIPTNQLGAGVYFIKISAGDLEQVIRFVK